MRIKMWIILSGFFKERESRETRGGLQLERRLLPL